MDIATEVQVMVRGRSRIDLDADRMLELALTRLIEILGEAASSVPIAERQKYPKIDWPRIVGMRKRLVHAFDQVDLDVLWETARIDVPLSIEALRDAVEPERQPGSAYPRALDAAATVASMSLCVCAVETNIASNGEGGRYTPSPIIR